MKRWPKSMKILVIVTTLFCYVIVSFYAVDALNLSKHGVKTIGTITQVANQDGNNGVLTYKDQKGNSYQVYTYGNVGDKQVIYYNPSNPQLDRYIPQNDPPAWLPLALLTFAFAIGITLYIWFQKLLRTGHKVVYTLVTNTILIVFVLCIIFL